MKNKPTDMGMNRTGMDQCSSKTRQALLEVPNASSVSAGDVQDLAAFRRSYIKSAHPIGNVPVPGSLKGIAQSVMQKLTGKKPEVLIDKLGERLAFERTGTRLYDAVLMKCQVRTDEVPNLPLEQLQLFRDEEVQHFALVRDVIKSLGADPTAVTPCADTDGVAAMGLMQVISDPRTSVLQSLHAIHIAELADNDGWQLLISLTNDLGLTDIATRFRQALVEEERHLEAIRTLMARSIMVEAGTA
jgi:hypothetical protein